MLTNPNKELYLKGQRGSGFFMNSLAQSRLEVTNRCFADNRNVPFYLEEEMAEKKCKYCNKIMPLSKFAISSVKGYGYYYAGVCKKCKSTYDAKSHKERRKNNPIKARERDKFFHLKNRIKRLIYPKVSYAIKEGKLIKPKLCSICKQNKVRYGHHPDYSKPLEVIWVCGSCHKQLHHITKEINGKE